MSAAPLRVAVLGAGTVGREVVRAFEAFPERLAVDGGPRLELAGVAVRDLGRARAAGIDPTLLTDGPAHLVADPGTDVVVEVMGGDEPARTLIAAALGAGKPVVTANKHVIAHHGPALERIARGTGTPLRFEAAVGGGIPVLAPLAGLAADRVERVRGIVNGSTNHLLTEMAGGGRSYDEVARRGPGEGLPRGRPVGRHRRHRCRQQAGHPHPPRLRRMGRSGRDRAPASDRRRRSRLERPGRHRRGHRLPRRRRGGPRARRQARGGCPPERRRCRRGLGRADRRAARRSARSDRMG